MGWIFSAALVALCLLGAPPAAGGAPENSGKRGVPESSGKGGVPESSVKDIPEGVFPGEVRRLPGPRERDALSLLLGAAFFPSDRAGEELGKFLATLTGREPGPAAVRLRAYGEVHRGERGAGAAESAARLAEAFREGRARAVRVAPPPARFLPRYPGGSTLMKVFVVILVIALAGFANLALVRRWRQRQEDTDSLPAGRRRFGRFD